MIDLEKPVSLYLHIPFCRSRCDYCSFYSTECFNNEEKKRFLEILVKEIKETNKIVGKSYETIFIGGGNPGILTLDELYEIAVAATENGQAKEFTIETNPENLTLRFKDLFPLVTRISIGIQSMDKNTLSILGRNASVLSNEKALSLSLSLPFDFNADLITAVPGGRDSREDVDIISGYGIKHISLYSLTIEKGTPISKRIKNLENEDEILFSLWKHLEEKGYEHYEISAFCKEGKRCMHNMVYWNLGQYIGLGAGAESSLGYKRIMSLRQNEDLSSFLTNPTFSKEELSKQEGEEEFLLVSLRKSDGIDKEEYRERFGYDFDQRFKERILKLSSEQYINSGDKFSLTEKGFMFLDSIILSLSMSIT